MPGTDEPLSGRQGLEIMRHCDFMLVFCIPEDVVIYHTHGAALRIKRVVLTSPDRIVRHLVAQEHAHHLRLQRADSLCWRSTTDLVGLPHSDIPGGSLPWSTAPMRNDLTISYR